MSKTWLVSQGRIYDIERSGEYIWAPKQTKDGAERFYWNNLTKVSEGDIILHYFQNADFNISSIISS